MATEYIPMSGHALFQALNKFIDDNRHSNDVEKRWLAELALPLHYTIREWNAGGMCSLGPDHRKALAEFRLLEIEEKQSKLDKEKRALSEEAEKLKKKVAA